MSIVAILFGAFCVLMMWRTLRRYETRARALRLMAELTVFVAVVVLGADALLDWVLS